MVKFEFTFFSPLDIFELIILKFPNNLGCSFINLPYVTNLIFFSFVILVGCGWVLHRIVTINNYIYPTRLFIIVRALIAQLKDLFREIIGGDQQIHFVLFFVIYLLLIVLNLTGLLPYSISVTSHFSITFTLSFMFFVGFNIIGVMKHKKNIVLLWLPGGTPYIIMPFIILIELISYGTRVFSLAIRLFANIMSGHTLIKILSGFAWLILTNIGVFSYFAVFPFFIIFLISGLEFAIAILQAYVFVVLLVVYLNDSINLH